MTFEEVIETVRRSGMKEKDKTPVILALLGLKDEYASPVQMTTEQKELFIKYREMGFDQFNIVTKLPELLDVESEGLMRAWLHPKLIKEVEDESK